MLNVFKSHRNPFRLILFTMLLISGCTTTAVDVDDSGSKLEIDLYLQEAGNMEADFSGSDLKAILQFSDSVAFTFDPKKDRHIQPFIGNGQLKLSNEAVRGDSVLSDTVLLYWIMYPDQKDTNDVYYDSICFQIGQVKSNYVRVNVVNLAPYIDSVMIGDTSISVFRDVFSNSWYSADIDTTGNLDIQLGAKDRDNDNIFMEWNATVNPTNLKVQFPQDYRAVYEVPASNFRDTLSVFVSDGKGGNAQLYLVLQKTSGVSLLTLDSVKAGDTRLSSDADIFIDTVVSIDSLLVGAYLSTSGGVSGRGKWTANSGLLRTIQDDSLTLISMYTCTSSTCGDTLDSDTSIILDTLTFEYVSSTGENFSRYIIFIQFPDNDAPSIDSIKAPDTLLAGKAKTYRLTLEALDTVTLTAYTSDPDGVKDIVSVSWSTSRTGAFITSQNSDSVSFAVSEGTEDTVIISAEDAIGFSVVKKLYIYGNTKPVVDSVVVEGSTFDSVFTDFTEGMKIKEYTASVDDTLSMIVYGSDSDSGALTYYWEVGGGLQPSFSVSDTSGFQYICADSAYYDTAVIIIEDQYLSRDTVYQAITVSP